MDHRRRAWRAAADWDYRTDCVDAAKQEDGGAAAEQHDSSIQEPDLYVQYTAGLPNLVLRDSCLLIQTKGSVPPTASSLM